MFAQGGGRAARVGHSAGWIVIVVAKEHTIARILRDVREAIDLRA